MKIKTLDAARSLGIHPAHLLLHVAELEKSLTFSDVWPEIDEAWVETVSAAGGHPRQSPETGSERKPSVPSTSEFSGKAIRVLDKLMRQKKWGDVSVTFDALLNLTRISRRELEDVITELRKGGLLDRDGTGRKTISLTSSKRNDIERLVQRSDTQTQ